MPKGVYKHKPHTEAAKQKIREAKLGKRPPNFGVSPSQETRQKISRSMQGNHNNFRGGIYTSIGYIFILLPTHPRANCMGYVKRADLVMERMLERPLSPEEIVDHKNKIRGDDRPENLRLFANDAEHRRFHAVNGDYFGRQKKEVMPIV